MLFSKWQTGGIVMERKRIVVKIGSSSLTNAKGEIDKVRLMDHVQAIAELKKMRT